MIHHFEHDNGFRAFTSGESLPANGELTVPLRKIQEDLLIFFVEETSNAPSGYTIALRIFETERRANQIGTDFDVQTGQTGVAQNTVDLPAGFVIFVVKNEDNANPGSVDFSIRVTGRTSDR